MADGVLDKESVEVARAIRRVLHHGAPAVDPADDAHPGPTKRAGDDGDRRRKGICVRLFWAAPQSDSKQCANRSGFL